jgi:hypothetical protein
MACAKCHREIDRTYRQTGMDRSISAPADGNTIEDYSTNHDFEHAVSDTFSPSRFSETQGF